MGGIFLAELPYQAFREIKQKIALEEMITGLLKPIYLETFNGRILLGETILIIYFLSLQLRMEVTSVAVAPIQIFLETKQKIVIVILMTIG